MRTYPIRPNEPGPWRKRLVYGTCALLLVFFALMLAVRHAGTFLEAGARPPVKSDLIVALGGELGERSEKVAELYRAGYAASILMTGFAGGPAEAREQYRHWRVRYLAAQGVPQAAVLIDAGANNSWEEAVNTLTLMQARGWTTVLVVSDPPHIRRLTWTWERVFAGSGKEYRLIAAPMRDWNADSWWRDERAGIFVVNEYLKMAYYAARR
jgi:uncharacterized SAM-binding protein YcdF (DUF218 family)